MPKTDTVYMRIDPVLKSDAEAVLSRLGLTPNEAINIFLNQVVLQKGIPFAVKIPTLSREQAIAQLMEEVQKGEDSLQNEPLLSLQELKDKLKI